MASPNVIDSASRTRQLTQFFAERGRERSRRAASEAAQKQNEFLDTLRAGNVNQGVILSHVDFGKRLQTLNKSLYIRQSIAYPDQGAVYVHDGVSNMDDLNLEYRGMKMVAAMAWGMMPERSSGSITRNEKGDEEGKLGQKGWRLTLCQLIQSRLITLPGAERLFGVGEKGWHEKLH